MSDDRSAQWAERLGAIKPTMKTDAFLAVFLYEDGSHASYGADYSGNPKLRAKLVDYCCRFIREMKKLDRTRSEVTRMRGTSREQ